MTVTIEPQGLSTILNANFNQLKQALINGMSVQGIFIFNDEESPDDTVIRVFSLCELSGVPSENEYKAKFIVINGPSLTTVEYRASNATDNMSRDDQAS